MAISAGAIIDGRYRAEQRLGAGGVGEVWAGVKLEDGSRVALKTLLPAASTHRELVTRFKREASFLQHIRSKYIAAVLDFFSDDVLGLVLVLEFVEGEALNEVLKRGRLSVEEAVDVCWDVTGGLADLHRERIIHRDLKPGNIIVKRLPNGKMHAVIVDFGMSRMAGTDRDGEEITALTRADIAVGTMEYMAPEQVLNSRGVTAAADIYALGAMLYRALAGQHIFGDLDDVTLARRKLLLDPPPLSTGRSDVVARGFEAIIGRMVQRNPKDRYERAEDVFADLAALRAGQYPPGLATSPSAPNVASSPLASSPELASSPLASSPELASSPLASSPEAAPSLTSSSPVAAPRPTPAPSARSGGGLLLSLLGALLLGAAALVGAYFWKPAWFRGVLTRIAPPAATVEPEPAATPAAQTPAPAVSIAPEVAAPATPVAPSASESASTPTPVAAELGPKREATPPERQREAPRPAAVPSKPAPDLTQAAPAASGPAGKSAGPKPLQVEEGVAP